MFWTKKISDHAQAIIDSIRIYPDRWNGSWIYGIDNKIDGITIKHGKVHINHHGSFYLSKTELKLLEEIWDKTIKEGFSEFFYCLHQ